MERNRGFNRPRTLGRASPQSTATLLALLLLAGTTTPAHALGYLKTPRSRNLVAYEDTVWWPRTETDPEPETTPQGADRGGTLAQCGIIETLRNYDLPQNILGELMPVNVQYVYEQEAEITIEASLISSNGGHFQFSLCPIEWGEVPTQECFDAHPLEFVKDNYYGAYEDPNYPERIYIPDGDVTGRVDDTSGFPGNKQAFSYQMNLPCGLTGDLVLLQWYFVTAQDCYHPGYLEYDFPPEWGDVFEEKINECPVPLPPDGNGLPLQYWNCAEVQILKTGPTDRCAPTRKPSSAPTRRVTTRPTNEPTPRPTRRPVVDPTNRPSRSPVEAAPVADCDELCLVPIESNECSLFDDAGALPQCLAEDGTTVDIGSLCEGSGECDTSDALDNCGTSDVYRRAASCARDDFGVTPEDTPISLPVLENDVDGVGEGLTIVDYTEPTHGTVELVGDELLYSPDEGYNGPDGFEYSIIDGDGFLSDADAAVEVVPVNDAPAANDDAATTPQNTQVRIPVLENDSDPDGQPLTIDSVTQPSDGVAGIRPDGTVVYKPDPGFVGEDTFTYKVCDEDGACDEATVTVTVEPPPNEPPVAQDDFVTIPEGMNPGPQIPVLVNDDDPDGDPLTVTAATQPENGSVEISPDEEGVVYTPDDGFTGVDTFEYITCDPLGLCDTALVTVTVDPANDDPIVFDDREDTPEDEPVAVNVLANDIPDIGLEVTEVTQPENGECEIGADGTVVYTPGEGFVGQDECMYTACAEGTTDCDEGTLVVDVIEVPKQPPLAVDDPVTTPKDQPVTLDPLDNDKSPSESPLDLVDVADGGNGVCVINEDDTVTYTPDEGFVGVDICLYTVCNENELCDEGAIVVSVTETNEPPSAEDDFVSTPFETPVKVDVTSNDVDPDGDDLTVAEVTQGLHGECTITDDNHVSYQPEQGYSGPDICPYVVCDPSGECDTANVFIEVEPGPPVAEDDNAQTTPETPVLVDVVQNDSHPSEPLEVTDITVHGENGVCEVVEGKVQYMPSAGHSGADSCTYEVCVAGTDKCDEADLVVDTIPSPPEAVDDNAQTTPETPVIVDVVQNDSQPQDLPLEVTDISNQGENGSCEVIDGKVLYTPDEGYQGGSDQCVYTVCVEDTSQCDEGTVTVDVLLDPPNAADDSERTPISTPVTSHVVENDSHPQDSPLEVTSISSGPDNGSCEVVEDGYVEYTPDEGFIGSDSCVYEVCVQGTSACDSATLVVDVVEVKLVEDDKAETPQDTAVVVDVLDNDSYPEDPTTPLEIVDVTNPDNGVCEIVDNQIQYTPEEGFYGTDSCEYTVCVEGTEVCDEGTLTVDVIPQPAATDDEAATPPNTPVLVDVASNDQPQDPNAPLDVTGISDQGENGVCEVVANQVQYTPDEGFVGTDVCKYEVCIEGIASCDEGTLTVSIITASPTERPTSRPSRKPSAKPTAGNTKPFALDDFTSTPTNTPVDVDVLVNDFDFDGDELTVISTTEPSNGQATINQDGTVSYTPNNGFSGEDSFDYTITDGNGGNADATVTVSVVEPTQPLPETCDGRCFEPLSPDECPSCDPVELPSCSDATLPIGALCESDGECGLDELLNNCEGTFDVYRRVPCLSGDPDVCIPRDGETVTISASGDAYVADRTVFNEEVLTVAENPKRDTVIRWDLTEEICECVTIKRVKLRLYVVNPSRAGGFVHVMNPTWAENSVTWRNAPESAGPPLAKIGQAPKDTWIEVDITGLVSQSDEQVAVRIEACLKNMVQYASKEYRRGQFAPQLVVELGPPPIGMHLLASQHGGRKLGGKKSSSRSSSRSKSKKTSTSSKSSKPSESSSSSSSDDGSRPGEIPVCPDPNLGIDLSRAISREATDDATIVRGEQNLSFGSDALLEVNPSYCGEMNSLIKFDVGSLATSTIEYASILIHTIEGSSLNGAVFLQTPATDWSEETVTWRTAPEYENVIGSLSTIRNGMWYELDVTSTVKKMSSDQLSIRVVPSAVRDAPCEQIRAIFSSKELDGFAPQLVLVPKRRSNPPPSSQSSSTHSKSSIFAYSAPLFDDNIVGSDASARQIVFVPSDDAYVSPRRKSWNYGQEPTLRVDGSPGNVALALMKFDLTSLQTKTITSAVLRVYPTASSVNGGTFFVMTRDADSDWDEDSVNWKTKPLPHNRVGELRRVRVNKWQEIDISNVLAGNAGRLVTIAIESTGMNGIAYSSKDGAHPPQLILTYEQ
ncbi:hypothetical protein ACHAXT_010750 [Thalassiosira profunda]